MRKEIADYKTHEDKLWLVVPDFPDELPVVWLVMGKSVDHPQSITIPIKREHLEAVISALCEILNCQHNQPNCTLEERVRTMDINDALDTLTNKDAVKEAIDQCKKRLAVLEAIYKSLDRNDKQPITNNATSTVSDLRKLRRANSVSSIRSNERPFTFTKEETADLTPEESDTEDIEEEGEEVEDEQEALEYVPTNGTEIKHKIAAILQEQGPQTIADLASKVPCSYQAAYKALTTNRTCFEREGGKVYLTNDGRQKLLSRVERETI